MGASFATQRIVKSSEIDGLNHVNNVVYVQWMNDVAEEHWTFLIKEKPMMTAYIWVTIKHEIEYLKPAVLNDKITIKTWIGTTTGFKSERHMEIFRDTVLLVKAITVWGMLSAVTYKPVRITESVLKMLKPFK